MITSPTTSAPLVFERRTEPHPTGESIAYVALAPAGDRYLLYPPIGSDGKYDETGRSGGDWHVYVERNYATLSATATGRLPSEPLSPAYSLASASATAQGDADRRARDRAIADGTWSAADPWTETTVEYHLQRLQRHPDGSETWDHMYTLRPNDDPAREARSYASNRFRRVVEVTVTRTFAVVEPSA